MGCHQARRATGFRRSTALTERETVQRNACLAAIGADSATRLETRGRASSIAHATLVVERLLATIAHAPEPHPPATP